MTKRHTISNAFFGMREISQVRFIFGLRRFELRVPALTRERARGGPREVAYTGWFGDLPQFLKSERTASGKP
jgi:hypothetical protein